VPEAARATFGIVGESAFGPALQAAVVALTARNRISRRDMSELVWELFGVRVSVGAIDRICQRTSGLLAGPHAQLTSQVLGSTAINMDETGWYLAGENRTMWTASTGNAAIFRIVADRHRDRLIEWLGPDFKGIVTSDRWWAYDLLDPEQRQACWSHLQRDFRFHSEGLAAQQQFGEAGLALTRRLFETWHAYAEHHDRRRPRSPPRSCASLTRRRSCCCSSRTGMSSTPTRSRAGSARCTSSAAPRTPTEPREAHRWATRSRSPAESRRSPGIR
jgi:hypothetical protein